MNPKKLKIIIAGMAICIALVSFKFYEVNNDLKKFGEQGLWIGGLSDVYSKLCKK